VELSLLEILQDRRKGGEGAGGGVSNHLDVEECCLGHAANSYNLWNVPDCADVWAQI